MAESFEDFYRREWSRVVALLLALTGSRAIAEELTQEAFLRAHTRWAMVSLYQRPDQWVRRVAVNLAVSAFRRRAAERRSLARLDAVRPPSVDLLPAASSEVWVAVRALPRRQAQVVVLTYVEDLAGGDVARILGIAEPTVRTLLHRARLRLAALLNEPQPQEISP